MVAYHFLYDWVFLFQQPCAFMFTGSAYLWQQLVCSGFILLAGCCCTLSHAPFRRGLQILGCALLITLVTFVATPQERICFGILHCIGLAYLLTALLHPTLQKLPAHLACTIAILLFVVTKGIYYGYLGLLDWPICILPDPLYQLPLLFWLGLPDASFYSSDYFPLVPWYFLFLTGYLGGPAILHSKWFLKINQWQIPPLNWIGRNTLPLYLLHQPILYGLLCLLFAI